MAIFTMKPCTELVTEVNAFTILIVGLGVVKYFADVAQRYRRREEYLRFEIELRGWKLQFMPRIGGIGKRSAEVQCRVSPASLARQKPATIYTRAIDQRIHLVRRIAIGGDPV